MGYYLTNISISLNSKNDSEAIKKIENIISQIRETKEINPYVDGLKKAVVSLDGKSRKFESLDNNIIKNLNTKK